MLLKHTIFKPTTFDRVKTRSASCWLKSCVFKSRIAKRFGHNPGFNLEVLRALVGGRQPKRKSLYLPLVSENGTLIAQLDTIDLKDDSIEQVVKDPKHLNTRKFEKDFDLANATVGEEHCLDVLNQDGYLVEPSVFKDNKKLSVNSFSRDFSDNLKANGIIQEGGQHKNGHCEDRYVLDSFDLQVNEHSHSVVVPAVIDGHSGKTAAIFLQKYLQEALKNHLEDISFDFSQEVNRLAACKAIQKAFVNLAGEWRNKHPNDKSGADICCPIIINNYIFCANMGDSKALMVPENKDDVYLLTPDTECGDPKYAIEAAMRGLHIFESESGEMRGSPAYGGAVSGLATPFSFGDLRQKTSSIPIVSCSKVPEKNWQLFVYCDGIGDQATPNDIAKFILDKKDEDLEASHTELRNRHQVLGGGDDKTSIWLRFSS